MSLFIDTSILVSFYIDEANSESVHKIFSRPGIKTISSLIRVEFVSALSRRVRMKEFPPGVAQEMADEFHQHIAAGLYRFVTVTEAEYQLSKDWISLFNTPLRTLDALHLACVHRNGLKLLTADKALAASAKKLKVSVKQI